MTSIKFKNDRNGKKVAFLWNNGAMRWVRMNLAQAELLVATGENVEVCA